MLQEKQKKETIDLAVCFLKEAEGFVPSVYQDVTGSATVGYGFLVSSLPKNSWNGKTITRQQAEKILRKKCDVLLTALQKIHPSLNKYQLAALISFCYNCGLGAYKKSTLRKKIQIYEQQHKNSIQDEIKEQFLRWKRSKGRIILGLLNRRKKEAALFERGYYNVNS